MKKILVRLLSAFLTAALLIPAAPEAAAYEPGDPYSPDLSELIRDADHRTYVETLTDYYMRTNTSVWRFVWISRGSRISSISTRIAAPFRIARWNTARGSWKTWGRSAPQRFVTEPMNCIP